MYVSYFSIKLKRHVKIGKKIMLLSVNGGRKGGAAVTGSSNTVQS